MKGEDTAAFIAINHNKKNSDVLIENYRPGVAKRLGADYETLKETNPRLIYASISGFGQTEPYATRPGYDLIAQGMSGVMSVTGEPGGPPAKCGVLIGDLSGGTSAPLRSSAYIAREDTGRGQFIDTSLFEGKVTSPHPS